MGDSTGTGGVPFEPQLLEFLEDKVGSPPSRKDSEPEVQSPNADKRSRNPRLQGRPPWNPRAKDPTLDFFSPEFDALKALHVDLPRPNPRVAPLNTLSQCRFILPDDMPESLAHMQQVSTKTKEDVEQQRSKSGPARVRRLNSEWKECAVEKIATSVKKGPLLLLQQAYFLGSRVKVSTRHARGVRGSCTGLLRAFDKHMNLILQDVEEHYTVRLRFERIKLVHVTDVVDTPIDQQQGISGEAEEKQLEVRAVEKGRTCHRQDHRTRRLKQIFVRGSNVVMISACPAESQPSQPKPD